jgi:NAD(P)-dependent dehydrogenase (short-subunit alcohol dehydrogenase family)
MARFTGKVVIVTGGGSGIGRETALHFAREGALVVVANRRVEAGRAVVAEIERDGGTACFCATDVSKAEDVDALVAFAVHTYGGVDVAFLNAGTSGAFASTVDATEENFRNVLDVNVVGLWFGLRAVLRQMLAQGRGGAIVTCSSMAGLVGFADAAQYVASKHAVIGLTKSAALEVAPRGIRVNAVCPAVIDTPMAEGLSASLATPMKDLGAMHPIGRVGTPREVARVVLFLASDEASFMTGDAIAIDGGFTAR